jgi:hypothetical protein
VPHDCRYTSRIRQVSVYISREGRAYSPQIIIRRALQQEVLQILNIATQACSSQHSQLAFLGSAFNRTQLAKSVLSRHGRPTLATLFNLQMRAPDAQLSEVLQASKWQTQARVGWRSRARIQVDLGVQCGDSLGILAHGNTPTGGKPWVCMERALKARQKHGAKGLLHRGFLPGQSQQRLQWQLAPARIQ